MRHHDGTTYRNDLGYFASDPTDGQSTRYYDSKRALKSALESGEAWELERQPAIIPQPEAIENSDRTRQGVLITGLHLAAGQKNLFDDLDGSR